MTEMLETSEKIEINKKAFWSALLLAPLSIGVPSYGLAFLFIAFPDPGLDIGIFLIFPGVAMFVGAPTYLTFGAFAFWKTLSRGHSRPMQLAMAGLIAHFASTPVAALVFFLTDPDVLGPTLGFLALGLIFAPLWSVIFAALYKRMS